MACALLFPGQGAQRVGMARELFAIYPDMVSLASDVMGFDIERLCCEGPAEKLSMTRYTQPALFLVNAMAYMRYLDEGGEFPDFLAGHSLGEFNALHAAGAVDFATGLRLVKLRGELMSRADGGEMAAVVGMPIDIIRKVIVDERLELDVANHNAPLQTVVAGLPKDIRLGEQCFVRSGARVVRLAVSGAFHSRYMRPFESEFRAELHRAHVRQLQVGVLSNATGAPYADDQVRDLLARQICSPVLWVDCLIFLLRQPSIAIDALGVGGVELHRFVNQAREWIQNATAPVQGATPTDARPVQNGHDVGAA